MQAPNLRENRREIRRRSTLACDSCARSRVKCNGECPCRRCEDNAYECHYDRDVRKRGRKRKDPKDSHTNTSLSPSTPASPRVEQVQHARMMQDFSNTHRPASAASPPMSLHGASVDPMSGTPIVAAARAWDETSIELPIPDRQGLVKDGAHEDIWCLRGVDSTARHTSRGDGHRSLPSNLSPQEQDGSYSCLGLLLPHLQGILKPQLALKLLELYFAPPEGTLFHNASPYVLTPVLRRESVLNATYTRHTTPALLATMIWVSAQTASLPELLAPGSRSGLTSKLQDLVFKLQHDRDLDNWQRTSGGYIRKSWYGNAAASPGCPDRPIPVIDDVLTLILITIVTSGGDFKRDCLPWWCKTLSLIETMNLQQLDHPDAQCNDEDYTSSELDTPSSHPRPCEAREEMRRTYWLAFALDRHLALSYNGCLAMVDGESFVYAPLPERAWQTYDEEALSDLSSRQQGPSHLVTGTGFFEFFLPLMVLLGDIIQLRRHRHHPRLSTLEREGSIAMVEELLDRCRESIHSLRQGSGNRSSITDSIDLRVDREGTVLPAATPSSFVTSLASPGASSNSRQSSGVRLVTEYAHFILHVLYILLHGEWDALTMLAWLPSASSQDEWITTPSFHKCSSHAVYASEAISSILEIDPELIFMPYLFGIYLFHGSLVLLLFADRMPAVHGGPNSAVEAACETIIRAHEACIVTLNTEFQRVFKRVMRATLMVVKDQNKTCWSLETGEEMNNRGRHGNVDVVRERIVDLRKDMLKLYRWNRGGRGLGI